MEITKDTMVEVGGKKVSIAVLAQMLPALGLGQPEVQPAAASPKPRRRVVSSAKAPAGASALTKAIQTLKPSAAAAPTVIEAAAKEQKKHPGVTITISKEMVVVEEGKPAVEMLVLSKRCISEGGKGKPRKGAEMSHFNYAFDKGYCYYATKGATPPKPTWKWESEREVRFVPVEEIETLLEGLRRYYVGATLIIGEHKEVL